MLSFEEGMARFIRGWRRYHCVTQEELAEHLGVTRKTVSLWETGNHPPPDMLGLALETLGKKLRGDP